MAPRPARTAALSVLGLIALLGPAHAEAGSGCFERSYDAAHLARQPGQNVRRIVLHVATASSRDRTFGIKAWLRNRPQVWRAGGPCMRDASGWTCQPDTDGDPTIRIETTAEGARLINPVRLKLVDDRTGPDLNEARIAPPGDGVLVLTRTRDGMCAGE